MRPTNPQRFADLLTDALYEIKKRQSKPIQVIQDELGYAMGRNGGSVIENWRKGKVIPQRNRDVEQLAELLVTQGRLSKAWLEDFTAALGYEPAGTAFVNRLFPHEAPARAAKPTAPFQAPAPVSWLVGRQRELATICARLRQSPGPRLVALVGMGGIGKTLLATHVAHGLRGMFADGVLWAYANASDPLDIAEHWGRAYDYELSGLHDLQNRAAALRGILAERQALLVIDDVAHINGIQPLLPNSDACSVLLTTRNADAAAALGADIIQIQELSTQHGIELLTSFVGVVRVEAEHDAAVRICRQLDNLPLALEIVGQLLKSRPGRRLSDMADHLETLENRLNLRISDRAVRTSLSASWSTLDEFDQTLFACLGVFAGRAFTPDALASVAGLDLNLAEDKLYTLRALSLVRESGIDRFQQHPLLAGFAGEKLDATSKAHARMAEYYAQFAAHHEDESEMLAAEWENIAAAMDTASRLEAWSLLLAFGMSLTRFWFQQAHFSHARQGFRLIYPAAEALGDQGALAFVAHKLGEACLEQDDYLEANQWLEKSLAFYVAQNDERGCADIHYLLARMAVERADYPLAQKHIAHYRRFCEETLESSGLGKAYYLEAIVAYFMNDLEAVQACCDQAYNMQRDLESSPELLLTLRLMIDLAIERREYDVAESYCQQALQKAEAVQNLGELAALYYSMTVVMRVQKRLHEAQEYCTRSQALFEKMGDRGFLALAYYEQCRVQALLGERAAALLSGEKSVTLFRALDERFNLVYVLDHLGQVQADLGNYTAARAAWQEALTTAEPIMHPRLDQLRSKLGAPPDQQ